MVRKAQRKAAALSGIALVAAMLLVAACGDSDESTAVEEGGTVTIGTITPKTGPTAIYYEVTRGMQAYIDAVNEEGGVNGYTIEIKEYDDGGEPARALTAARRAVTEDEVLALVALNGTPTNAAMLPFLSQTGVPVVGPLFSNYEQLAETDNYFVLVPDYSWDAALAVQFDVETNGTERIGILYQNDALGIPGREGATTIAEELGIEVAADIGYDMTQSNFLPQVQQLKNAGAELVLINGSQTATAAVLEAAQRINFKPRWVVPYFQPGATLTELAGPLLEGQQLCASSYLPSTDQADNEVVQDVVEAFGPDHDIEAMTLNGWTQAALFVEALRIVTDAGDEVNQENLMAALRTIDAQPIGGAPQVTFTGDRPYGLDGSRILCTNDTGAFEQVSEFEPYPPSVFPGI